MIVKLLIEHHSEFLSLKGGYTGSSESTLVKMSNCWKSRAAAHIEYRIKVLIAKSNILFSFRIFLQYVFQLGSRE